jgi:dihydroorotate dehydrogenase electron transfer subunit
MACGVGACLGCVAKTIQGDYVQSCVHGPVFDVRDIELGA